jgi:hypothetical protein
MVFTLDALHTNKKTARLITEDLHAHYVLTLKGNQPNALTAAHAALSGTNADWVHGSAVEDDRGHGRTERRSIRTTPADDTLFPGARQVFRIRRDVGDLDNVWTTKEIVYGITSLPDGLAGPEHLNWYQRPTLDRRKPAPLDTRDMTFREDSSQLKTGTAPRAPTGLRNLAINTFRLAGRAPTSPTPDATSTVTTTSSPSSASDPKRLNQTKIHNAGALDHEGHRVEQQGRRQIGDVRAVPLRTVSTLISESAFTASRNELRDRPSRAASSASRCKRSPARSSPRTIISLMRSMASSVSAVTARS